MTDGKPHIVTRRMVRRVKEMLKHHASMVSISQQINCTLIATGLIVRKQLGVGDAIPPDMVMQSVPITRCVECGARINKLPDGEMPCLPCRIRATM